MSSETIRVVGARVHNLKNITVEIPRDKFVVITGLSGSGKSSLAFDTIFARGIAFRLRAPVHRADGQAGCGLYRRTLPRRIH